MGVEMESGWIEQEDGKFRGLIRLLWPERPGTEREYLCHTVRDTKDEASADAFEMCKSISEQVRKTFDVGYSIEPINQESVNR